MGQCLVFSGYIIHDNKIIMMYFLAVMIDIGSLPEFWKKSKVTKLVFWGIYYEGLIYEIAQPHTIFSFVNILRNEYKFMKKNILIRQLPKI